MGGHGQDEDDEDLDGGTVVDFDVANRRTDARVETELRVEYHSFDEFVVAYTEDISRGGLFMVTESPMPVGSVVRLNLVLPDNGPTVRIIARIAYVLDPKVAKNRSRSAGMGMEFLDIEGGSLVNQLDAYLTMNIGDEPKPDVRISANVLLVDPDERHSEYCAQILRQFGHEVSTAAGGLEALGLVLRVPPDVIVSEVDLPTMDGWRLLRLLRERPSISHIPFMFLTARDDEDVRLRAYQAGVDDVVAKSANGADLASRVERVLNRAQRPRRLANRNALRGEIGHVALGSVLAFIELERRTGQMLVLRGEDIATLHIKEGNVIHVDLPSQRDLSSLHRLFYVLDWTDGQFELTAMEVTVPPSIDLPTGYALMEHARRSDEAKR